MIVYRTVHIPVMYSRPKIPDRSLSKVKCADNCMWPGTDDVVSADELHDYSNERHCITECMNSI